MLAKNHTSTFLLASPEPALLGAVESLLLGLGARVQIALTAEAALAAITAEAAPCLALLDTKLPGMEMGQLLAAASGEGGQRVAIVLISDSATPEWMDRLAEGVVDDLILRSDDYPYWKLRLEMVLRMVQRARELEEQREAALRSAQTDHLTGVLNRETLLSMLFRETDRAQRMKSSLSLLLFDIDDFGHWNSRLGAQICDELLCQAATRASRLLRSFDLLGRMGKDEFLVALPGCSTVNGVMLAERLRTEVFSVPYRAGGEAIRLSACFGIAGSHGRSPVVVLREAEEALGWARTAGPESIQCFGEQQQPMHAPVTFLSASSGDELLAW